MRAALLLAALLAASPAGAFRGAPDDGLRALGPTEAAPERSARPASRPEKTATARAKGERVCALIKSAALEYDLPPAYFARLIWKESRFDEKAISPVGAQGIAQFMPATAKMVGLEDPWDPAQAIPASARHLADLRNEFGNLGLAAAAYNAGGGRVWAWLVNSLRGLPLETRDYVFSITGKPAEHYRRRSARMPERPLNPNLGFDDACAALPVLRTRALYAGAPRKPWGVQVAGNMNRTRALRAFNRYQSRFSRIIGGQSPQVVPKRSGRGRRALWSVQIGAGSRREAALLCSRLKRAGGACIVRRN